MCSPHHAFVADRVKKEGGSLSLVCEFDVDSLTSKPPKGKIGWLPQGATPCTVNQYDKLFNECEIAVKGDDGKVNVKEVSAEEAAAHKSKETGKKVDFIELFNPDSLKVCTGALVEPHAAASPALTRYQFTRIGYYVVDKVRSPAPALAGTLADTLCGHAALYSYICRSGLLANVHDGKGLWLACAQDSTAKKPIFNEVTGLRESKCVPHLALSTDE